MHVHLPKPLHGWREFIGEVGIIVVGVLIALAAEQLVENYHWRSETNDFREAVDHELGRNLEVWRQMMKVRPCVTRRLNDLERFLAASTDGRQPKLLRSIDRPIGYSGYYSVWDNKGAEVTAHLPPDVRQRYAEIYDELHNQDVARLSERDVWRELARFDQPEPLTHEDRMLLRELLTRARQLDEAERSNASFIVKLGSDLHIRPVPNPDQPPMPESDFCQPLLAR